MMVVLRGGSWNNNPQNLRSANRNNNKPTNRNNNIGFRCAKTLHGRAGPEFPGRGLRSARHAESIGLFLCWRGLAFLQPNRAKLGSGW
ncbi:MAG: SUMF1/EgtB/PvdO family nonheme iron enzyme [Nitrospirota bacterium]